MATLFNISEEQRRIMAMLEENEGEITPELEEALEVNQFNFEMKARDYRNAILMVDTDVAAAKEEKKRLDAFIKQREKAKDTMKQRLKDAMKIMGLDEVKIDGGVGGRISFRKSEQIVIDNEDAIPNTYRNVTYTIDKAGLKKALKEGMETECAHIEECINIQIK